MTATEPSARSSRKPTRKQGAKQGQARRDELRGQVLDIVETQLRQGVTFADVNVADVAAEAGISRSTFYAYFVDKTNLLRIWYAEFTHGNLEAARTWWSLDGTATRTDLHDALKAIFGAYRPHPELVTATHEAMSSDHGVREAVETSMRQYIEGLRVHIEIGQREGFVDPGLQPEDTAYWLIWMAERGMQMMTRRSPGGSPAQQIEAFASIVWNTLYAPTRTSPSDTISQHSGWRAQGRDRRDRAGAG